MRDGDAVRRRRRRGLLGRAGPVRLRHHRRAATRAPRSALARDGRLLAVACDGRADDEAGLTLAELAEALVALGAPQALNLDGGGSTSLVCGGRLRNVPREDHGVVLRGRAPGLDRDRVHAAVNDFGYNRRVRVLSALMFFPRGGSAHVARALARELPAHGCDVTVVSGSLPGRGDAERFYDGLRRPRGRLRRAATRRCTRPTRTARTPPTRVFAAVDDEAYEAPRRRLVAARWRRRAPPTPTSCTCTT